MVSHFSDTSLHKKLEAGLNLELMHWCDANKVDKILTLHPWALEVKHYTENCRADLKWAQEVTEEVFNRCEDSGKCHCNNSGHATAAAYTANSTTATATAVAGTV
jgi:hypothetical protein